MWNFVTQYMKKHLDSCIICSGTETLKYTYSDIIRIAEYHGKNLRAKIPKGCKCAIVCRSEYNTSIALLAVWFAQLVPIPTSIRYGEKHLKAIIELVSPDLVIMDGENWLDDLEAVTVYQMNNFGFLNDRGPYVIDEYLNDAALIMCTSGTTGTPKGAVITQSGLINNVLAINRYFCLNTNDTILISRPLYHCAVLTGEFLISLLNGANIVFFDKTYLPRHIIEACEKYSATVMCGTPTLFRHISEFLFCKSQKMNLRKIALSGERLLSIHAEKIRSVLPQTEIYHVYGLTEASPRVGYLPADLFDKYSESVGYPLFMTEVRVVRSSGEECQPYEHGLIMVKSPSIMKGYYQNKKLTEAVLQNGWLKTGDVGYKDDDDRLYILSRADDLIIKGGMNIYPQEIEARVLTLEPFDECVAFGFLFDDFQSIGINVVLNQEYKNMTIKEIKKILSKILPSYQMPLQINIVTSLKKNASGKTLRKSSSLVVPKKN